jgi:hypothetical protein
MLASYMQKHAELNTWLVKYFRVLELLYYFKFFLSRHQMKNLVAIGDLVPGHFNPWLSLNTIGGQPAVIRVRK